MAYTTINKHTAHFNTKLYTGNASTQAITGVGFQPDLVWIKNRSTSNSHVLQDAVRGADKTIYTNSTDAQDTGSTNVGSFDSDGFTLGSNGGTNGSGNNVASWNWKANGAGSSNSDGDITSTVSANTTSGFSIVKYTGSGTYQNTVGHGLGAVPRMIIVKGISFARDWTVYHVGMGNTKNMHLNDNSATATEPTWGNTTPTSSVFTISGASQANWYDTNKSGEDYIAYCFAEKTGYSKVSSYKGNGNADGPFIYTGFKPQFILVKNSSSSQSWYLLDIKRDIYNPMRTYLHADGNSADQDHIFFDFYSNGFKARNTVSGYNTSGDTYIYMAIGQSLTGSNDIPCTAR